MIMLTKQTNFSLEEETFKMIFSVLVKLIKTLDRFEAETKLVSGMANERVCFNIGAQHIFAEAIKTTMFQNLLVGSAISCMEGPFIKISSLILAGKTYVSYSAISRHVVFSNHCTKSSAS